MKRVGNIYTHVGLFFSIVNGFRIESFFHLNPLTFLGMRQKSRIIVMFFYYDKGALST